jgi:hypothetical protein
MPAGAAANRIFPKHKGTLSRGVDSCVTGNPTREHNKARMTSNQQPRLPHPKTPSARRFVCACTYYPLAVACISRTSNAVAAFCNCLTRRTVLRVRPKADPASWTRSLARVARDGAHESILFNSCFPTSEKSNLNPIVSV